jgi:hypothetical protein
MKFRTLGAVLLSMVLITVAATTLVPVSETRPTRAECIGGAELLWTGNERDRVVILNQLADVDPLTASYPRGGRATRHDANRIYIIFTRDCALKDQMMDQIMTIYRQNIPDFPPYRIIEGPVEPSTKTIQVYGDDWSDGEMPPGLMD